MIDFISRMTPGDWITFCIAVGACSCSALGAAWWMSAMFFKVSQIATSCDSFARKHESHDEKIGNHEGRIIRLESTAGEPHREHA